jgi:hypothetical protein
METDRITPLIKQNKEKEKDCFRHWHGNQVTWIDRPIFSSLSNYLSKGSHGLNMHQCLDEDPNYAPFDLGPCLGR